MIDYKKAVAESLLDIEAVKLQPNEPFTWASGLKSPIYTDNRLAIAFPAVRNLIAAGLADLIKTHYPDVEIIGGVATAGIPYAAWVAQIMDLPMIYVRSKPKDHGVGKQIEGVLTAGQKIVLIDDLISTGGSVLGTVAAARREGGTVLGVVSIFSYELAAADDNFGAVQTPFASLTTYSALIAAAQAKGLIVESDLETLHQWRENPSAWHKS
ncbi:orotate phosphoribosyltransferase [Weissella soli]|uniref:orotate phosphoribosyltransferase n=1 Tax=Weissella soli TaxID=155866 RepID=UPI0011BB36CE|nr:orotate phosphoribosyltransferase [Weissella soli]QEA34344.1 orotate phosphoribosyltransferase [Weissella soli]